MKKWICLVLAVALCAMTLTACANDNRQQSRASAQNPDDAANAAQDAERENSDNGMRADVGTQEAQNDNADNEGKVLVVYYSASGNTRAVAETIAGYTDGDIFEIIPVEAYTDEDLNWTQKGSRVNLEHDDESLQDIELVSTTAEDFDSYDTVFIGYPIWWHEAAWVVNNFVKDNDFTGKTVIPFCTSSSSGLGESGTHLAEMAGTGDWKEGMRFSGNAGESEITEWLDGLGFTQSPPSSPDLT